MINECTECTNHSRSTAKRSRQMSSVIEPTMSLQEMSEVKRLCIHRRSLQLSDSYAVPGMLVTTSLPNQDINVGRWLQHAKLINMLSRVFSKISTNEDESCNNDCDNNGDGNSVLEGDVPPRPPTPAPYDISMHNYNYDGRWSTCSNSLRSVSEEEP